MDATKSLKYEESGHFQWSPPRQATKKKSFTSTYMNKI